MRTWFPLTPNTVTVTSFPIITVSPTRLVKINIICAPQLPRHFAVQRTELEDLRRQAFHRLSPREISTGRSEYKNPTF
jgi:hypothetical protein